MPPLPGCGEVMRRELRWFRSKLLEAVIAYQNRRQGALSEQMASLCVLTRW